MKMKTHHAADSAGGTLAGVDRLIRDVQTGRFERSLAALTAAGALVTAAETYLEHDKASFGNRWIWAPVVLGSVGAGVFSRRMAKIALPVASAASIKRTSHVKNFRTSRNEPLGGGGA